jgi:hypothetical protein
MAGQGPFGPAEMGGMFTLLKVRAGQKAGDYRDPGWFKHPAGAVAREVPDDRAPPAPRAPGAGAAPAANAVQKPAGHHH